MDINPLRLLSFAKLASSEFVEKGTALNSVIAKLAEENDLNPMQIRRIAEVANHDVQASLFKGASDKSFTFDLADPVKITQMLQMPAPLEKVASLPIIHAAFDRPVDRASFVKEAAEAWMDDSDQRLRDLKVIQHDLTKLAMHIEHFAQEVAVDRLAVSEQIDESMDKIAGMAKNHIIMNNGKLSDLFKFACSHDPEFSDGWAVIFGTIKDDLMKLGAPVDRSLIYDKLEIPSGELEIINGGHILAIELDTLKNKISEEDKVTKRGSLLGTFGDAVVDRIRVLKTPEDMNKSILEDVGHLSKEAEFGVDSFINYLEKEAGIGTSAAMIGGTLLLGAGVVPVISGMAKETTKSLGQDYDAVKRMQRLTRGDS